MAHAPRRDSFCVDNAEYTVLTEVRGKLNPGAFALILQILIESNCNKNTNALKSPGNSLRKEDVSRPYGLTLSAILSLNEQYTGKYDFSLFCEQTRTIFYAYT